MLFSAVGAIATAQAQTVAPAIQNELRNTLQREQAAQAEQQRRLREQFQQRESAPGRIELGSDQLSVPEGGPCFDIEAVEVQGHAGLGDFPEVSQKLVGSCATLSEIVQALNAVNQHYKEHGFITTRAYLPEQDVSTGHLSMVVVPGLIEGYVYADGRQADLRVRTAFRGQRGDVLNLRDLEQGLEVLNGPRSSSATFKLVPGEQPGGSFVMIEMEETLPLHLTLGVDNSGFDNTGAIKTTVGFGLDNLLSLNDQLTFNVGGSPLDDRNLRYSENLSLRYSIPVRSWEFALEGGASRYFFKLDGVNQSFPVEGQSHYVSLFVERLLWRDQLSKHHAYGELKLSRSRSYIDGFEIMSQRRRLAVADVGWRAETRIGGAMVQWDVGAKFGLDAFGSGVTEKSIVDPTFKMVHARLDVRKPIADTSLTYVGAVFGQYSKDVLPGTEQIAIGGWSSVRGFHQDNLYGDAGAYWRNSIEWNAISTPDYQLTLSGGFDAGIIEPSELRSWSQDYLVGAHLGAELAIGDHATLDFKIAHAISRPDQNPPNANPAFEDSRTVGFASLDFSF
ncbi:ShlB/FhaC/HecB family hemolysin secretion/activation protein [Pseudovibrio exalbescens]|nr:ShlB/FhaC/HecB family hemolysin secretion/activation protein [Pseudovibrio exalbescens]